MQNPMWLVQQGFDNWKDSCHIRRDRPTACEIVAVSISPDRLLAMAVVGRVASAVVLSSPSTRCVTQTDDGPNRVMQSRTRSYPQNECLRVSVRFLARSLSLGRLGAFSARLTTTRSSAGRGRRSPDLIHRLDARVHGLGSAPEPYRAARLIPGARHRREFVLWLDQGPR
jgi:hypothetical protein